MSITQKLTQSPVNKASISKKPSVFCDHKPLR